MKLPPRKKHKTVGLTPPSIAYYCPVDDILEGKTRSGKKRKTPTKTMQMWQDVTQRAMKDKVVRERSVFWDQTRFRQMSWRRAIRPVDHPSFDFKQVPMKKALCMWQNDFGEEWYVLYVP